MSNTRKILYAIAGFYVVGLVLVAVIFGVTTHKNDAFQPQNEFKLTNWVHLGASIAPFSTCSWQRSARSSRCCGSRGGCISVRTRCKRPSRRCSR